MSQLINNNKKASSDPENLDVSVNVAAANQTMRESTQPALRESGDFGCQSSGFYFLLG